MLRTTFLVFALALALPSLARAKETLEYLDLLGAEAVGELDRQRYDERANDRFVGTRDVAGMLVGGGVGVRPVFRFADGIRFSIELSGTWGRLRDADPGVAYSTVSRVEFLTGLGYELHVGHSLALHTVTLVGLDGQWMDRAQQIQLFDVSTMASSASLASSSLSRVDLRLGQQLGAHLQLAHAIALYADGTVDYDGQWRLRAGIAIGKLLR